MNKKTAKIKNYLKSGIAAALIPLFFIYVFIDKPDYKIMNRISFVVVPVASWVADGVTWPLRVIGRITGNIRVLWRISAENKELRARLDEALAERVKCGILEEENARLEKQLNFVQPQKHRVAAHVIHDNTAFQHRTFIIDRGESDNVREGMAVISFDGFLVGIVDFALLSTAKVRALSDSKSVVPVRVAGSDVFGFLNGEKFEFFSDPLFVPTTGLKLITSGIKNSLPAGIPVGTIDAHSNIIFGAPVAKLHEVVILIK